MSPFSYWCCAMLLILGAPSLAQSMSVEELARIRHAEAKALSKVREAYGNRRPSELSSDERRRLIADEQAASRHVYEQLGVDVKTYERSGARLPPESRQALEGKTKELAAEEVAKARAAQPAPSSGDQLAIEELPKRAKGGGKLKRSAVVEFDKEGNPVPVDPPSDAPPEPEKGSSFEMR